MSDRVRRASQSAQVTSVRPGDDPDHGYSATSVSLPATSVSLSAASRAACRACRASLGPLFPSCPSLLPPSLHLVSPRLACPRSSPCDAPPFLSAASSSLPLRPYPAPNSAGPGSGPISARNPPSLVPALWNVARPANWIGPRPRDPSKSVKWHTRVLVMTSLAPVVLLALAVACWNGGTAWHMAWQVRACRVRMARGGGQSERASAAQEMNDAGPAAAARRIGTMQMQVHRIREVCKNRT